MTIHTLSTAPFSSEETWFKLLICPHAASDQKFIHDALRLEPTRLFHKGIPSEPFQQRWWKQINVFEVEDGALYTGNIDKSEY